MDRGCCFPLPHAGLLSLCPKQTERLENLNIRARASPYEIEDVGISNLWTGVPNGNSQLPRINLGMSLDMPRPTYVRTEVQMEDVHSIRAARANSLAQTNETNGARVPHTSRVERTSNVKWTQELHIGSQSRTGPNYVKRENIPSQLSYKGMAISTRKADGKMVTKFL
jgi:hypothetical protein